MLKYAVIIKLKDILYKKRKELNVTLKTMALLCGFSSERKHMRKKKTKKNTQNIMLFK
jgi:hypothetical protein